MTTFPLLAVQPVPVDALPDPADVAEAGIIAGWLVYVDHAGVLCKLPAPGSAQQDAFLGDLLRHVRREKVAA